jgi:hypothetical protein
VPPNRWPSISSPRPKERFREIARYLSSSYNARRASHVARMAVAILLAHTAERAIEFIEAVEASEPDSLPDEIRTE